MAFHKVTAYKAPCNILDSEVGLVTKTHQATKDLGTANDEGRTILAAGTLYTDPETNEVGIVFEDYDLTDYEKFPISVIVEGRVLYQKVSAETQAKAEELAKQHLLLVGKED